MICEWSTLCFIIINPIDGKQYVMKDCWIHSGQIMMEEDMLRRMKGNGVLAVAWTVQIFGKNHVMDLWQSNYLFKQGFLSSKTQIHCHLLLESVGKPLTWFSYIQELLSVLIDVVDSEYTTAVTISFFHFILCLVFSAYVKQPKKGSQCLRLSTRLHKPLTKGWVEQVHFEGWNSKRIRLGLPVNSLDLIYWHRVCTCLYWIYQYCLGQA